MKKTIVEIWSILRGLSILWWNLKVSSFGHFIIKIIFWQLEVSVHNIMEERGSSNVIGILYGSEEPDRYQRNTEMFDIFSLKRRGYHSVNELADSLLRCDTFIQR
jgi:hypothetical protein